MASVNPLKESEPTLHRFGPKTFDHPTVGKLCPGCDQPLKPGDYTAIIRVGPGDREWDRDRCRRGLTYGGVGVELHWVCATGYPE